MSRRRFTALLWCLGAGSLLLGIAFYGLCRAQPPLFLQLLSLHSSAPRCGASPALGALPSLLHAFAMTCLLAALWGGGRVALVASGLFWFALNALGEWTCATEFASAQARISLTRWLFLQPDLAPTCSFDLADVIAAAVGAALPVAVHMSLVLPGEERLSSIVEGEKP